MRSGKGDHNQGTRRCYSPKSKSSRRWDRRNRPLALPLHPMNNKWVRFAGKLEEGYYITAAGRGCHLTSFRSIFIFDV